ncbi:hypothetical protein [Actinomadura rubrisoli]|uniref:Uncharacterized protein n=1 Tax=Actinomadura rubrisoli TaxID=2530368 RepID=A0A4R5BX42_9ACTN|nr:hypothetical protein [Actinomadura rubrisoli]TDD91731.1 hypothetical protein E1298_11730 [Actinomadura rubrisoli]
MTDVVYVELRNSSVYIEDEAELHKHELASNDLYNRPPSLDVKPTSVGDREAFIDGIEYRFPLQERSADHVSAARGMSADGPSRRRPHMPAQVLTHDISEQRR